MDAKRDFARAIYNLKTRKFSGTSEEIARQYLKENKDLLRMEKDLSDLKFLETKKSPAGSHVGFIQVYKGIPVFRSETVVSINPEGHVGMVFNGHKPDIDVSATPTIGESRALDLARSAIGVKLVHPGFEPKAELIIYEDSFDEYHLAWKVIIVASEPEGTWMLLIEANTGLILESFNTLQDYVNGTGRIFKPDPGTELRNVALKDSNDADYQLLQPAYDLVSLYDLNNAVGGIYRIRGRYAYSRNITAPNDSVVNASNPSGFTYKRNQNGFEEASIYFYIDNQRRYLGTLGFSPTWKYLGSGSETIAFDARGTPEANAYYDPTYEYLRFGVPSTSFDAGEDQSVILHEYGHALHDAFMIGGTETAGLYSDTRGISEGIAEYMGIDYRRLQQSNPFRPNARSNWFGLSAIDSISIKLPADAKYPIHWGSDPYSKMKVWASMLMDCEYTTSTNPAGGTRFGRDVTMRLILTSLAYLTSSATAQDYMWAILQADRDIPEYKGIHLNDLADIFDNRGFFSSNKVTGAITSNTTWSKPMLVTGDVTVSSGVTLTIKPNSSRMKQSFVFFESTDDQAGGYHSSKCELIINGTLKADSTTFIAASKGSWYGIRFTSSGTNSSYLSKCTVKNAYIAVYVDGKNPRITQCFIDDASQYGVYILQSTAWPLIDQNYIEADFACVCHSSNGNGYFNNNSFRNAQYGSYVISGSPAYDYYNIGRNKYETSITRDKVIITTGLPILNTYQYFSIPNSGYKYIRNNGTGSVLARNDYWSANPPSDTYFYGTVDRSNPLASPPTNPTAGPGWALPKTSAEDFFIAFDKARMLFFDENYTEARDYFRKLADSNRAMECSAHALNWYMFASEQLEPITNQTDYLSTVQSDKTAAETTRFYATKWLLQCALRDGFTEEAHRLASEAVPGSASDRELSLDLAMGLFAYRDDPKLAEEALERLSRRFQDPSSQETIRLIRLGFIKETVPINTPTVSTMTETEETLIEAFPTPFNASTMVRYRMIKSGRVFITVYNVLGRKVSTLLDANLESGRHEVIWDGKDQNGITVPSGVYFCRIVCPDLKKTIKLVMTK